MLLLPHIRFSENISNLNMTTMKMPKKRETGFLKNVLKSFRIISCNLTYRITSALMLISMEQ